MAKKVSIPITDHAAPGVCTAYYKVEYKLNSEPIYTALPNAYSSPIEITNLLEDATYDVRITRYCCEGLESAPLTLAIVTS